MSLNSKEKILNAIIANIRQTEVVNPWNVSLHNFMWVAGIAFLTLSVMAGCMPTSVQNHTPAAIASIHVHSYFSGYAFLDANGNGDLDTDDTPINDATFTVTLQGDTEFGDQTDETGYAFITIPAGVEYPVTVRMEAPQDSGLKLIGPSEVIFTSGDESPKFLFISE